MSIIVKSLQHFESRNQADRHRLFTSWTSRLRTCRYPASRFAWLIVGVSVITVAATLCRPASQIEARIASAGEQIESRSDHLGAVTPSGRATDSIRAAENAMTSAGPKSLHDSRPSSPDLALPLSRHVLKFVPPPAYQYSAKAVPLQKSTDPPAAASGQSKDQPAAATDPAPNVADASIRIETSPPVQDPLIRLAATACFDGRERCTAVISGQTLRVGQNISGYEVAHIGTGEVLMQKNGKTWLLKMDHGN